MSRSTQTDKLKSAFETHREETEKQIERLEQVFELCGKRPQGKPCEAIQGIIEESKEIMDDFKGSQVLDAGLIAAAQAVEHYEIRSEEHTSELQSLMRISYAVFCLKKKKDTTESETDRK